MTPPNGFIPVVWAHERFPDIRFYESDGKIIIDLFSQSLYEDWDAMGEKHQPKLMSFHDGPPNSGWERVECEDLSEALKIVIELGKLGKVRDTVAIAVETQKCNLFGCSAMKTNWFGCDSCLEDFREDPDAYK